MASEPLPVPGARWLPLTRGKFALVDEGDFERLAAYRWKANRKRDSFYASARSPDGSTVYMHRLVVGAGPGEEVDHINHDTLDNRDANLRRCTRVENHRNSKLYRKRTCAFKGVSANKNQKLRKPWQAAIKLNGKRIPLGRFATAEEAAHAYDAAVRRHYGEFAAPNFPETGDA